MRKVILMAVFLCLTIGVSFGQFSTGTNTVSGTISYSTYSDDGEDGVNIVDYSNRRAICHEQPGYPYGIAIYEVYLSQ